MEKWYFRIKGYNEYSGRQKSILGAILGGIVSEGFLQKMRLELQVCLEFQGKLAGHL